MKPTCILLVFLSEAPWQYYIQYEQYLNTLKHPFREHVHVLRDTRMEFPEAIFKQYRVIAFYYHDPLASLYPKQYAYAKKLASFCLQHGIRLLNQPEALSQSVKSVQLKRLHQAGFRVAQSFPIPNAGSFKQIPPQAYPLFIRFDAGHDSQGGHVQGPFYSLEALEQEFDARLFQPGKHTKDILALQWIDTVSPDGLYRKYRVYATPMSVLKAFIAIAPDWYVHWDNTTQDDIMRQEDEQFIESPLSDIEFQLFTSVVKTLNLDFCGIDYAYLPSGDIVIWEVNPHPSLDGTEEPIRTRVTELLSNYYLSIINEYDVK